MKILFLIVLLLFSSSLAEEEFVQLVCSFREDSIPEDTALEGWGSVPFLTGCGGIVVGFTFDTISNLIEDIPPHDQIKIEYQSYCEVGMFPVGQLGVDDSLVTEFTATVADEGPIRDCTPMMLSIQGQSQTVSEVVNHTASTLSVEIQYFEACFAWDVKISYKPLDEGPDPQECFDHLGTLMDGEGNTLITNSCDPFIQDGEQRFKFTTMFLEPYVFNDDCLDIEVWFQDTLLPEGDGELDQWSFDGENQKIIWNLNFKDFSDKYNCEDGEIGSQLFWKCDFSVKLIFDGEIQLEYTSKIQVVVDTIFTDSLEVDVQKNVVEGVCCENQLNVETQLQFCTDMNCDSFLDSPLSIVRKESFFVLHSIVNPEFQSFYLKFLEAQLGEFIPSIIKYDSSQPGKLILELQSNVAKNNMVLSVISQLHKNPIDPDMGGENGIGNGNRFLQEDSITQAQQRLNNNEYKVAGYEQISVSYGSDLKSIDQEKDTKISSSSLDKNMDLEKEQEEIRDSKTTIFIIMLMSSLILSFGLVCILVKFYLRQKKNTKLSESKYKESQKNDTEQELQQPM